MESWAIFKHAVRMVFGNLGDAIRVTGVLYIIGFALPLILFGHNYAFFPFSMSISTDFTITARFTTSLPVDGMQIDWKIGLFNFTLSWVCTIWISVAWHRYVLLHESVKFMPIFHRQENGYFFGALLLVSLIGWLIMMVWGLSTAIVLKAMGIFLELSMVRENPVLYSALGLALSAFFYAPSALIMLRLSVFFPMAALSRTATVNEALDATKGANLVLFGITVLAAVSLWIVAYLSGKAFELASQVPFLGILPVGIAGWIKIVVIASIVTTIYQRFVEGRETEVV